ncbi:Rrf2 family transcriptional regulator [Salinibacterium sp. M195]|uniref:RrF2 family transcriptional regulator n=1 Tax=Salinibacterium sp. M195 TaxID=2583374 RepID=UPI001C6314B7|nr:Rrf2 family transcriptional regulator [Salinibacterium sp. M195]QYH36632.1 Rrf2 family transcriptional regulator [Salinibacterium sp. M195]
MRINAFSDVCLRIIMLLSATPESELKTSRVIAGQIDTPYNHVSKAIIKLRELGLIESVRGRSGGVRISGAGRRATVGWVLRQLDVRADLADCETPDGVCPLIDGCGLRAALRNAREAFYSALDDVVISSLPHSLSNEPVSVTLGLRPPD